MSEFGSISSQSLFLRCDEVYIGVYKSRQVPIYHKSWGETYDGLDAEPNE